MTQSAPTRPQPIDDAANPVNKPADKFRESPVHVSVWENQGVNGTFRVASFELRYKKDEQWQASHSYGASDRIFLENAAKEARHRIESWLRTTGARQGHPPAAERWRVPQSRMGTPSFPIRGYAAPRICERVKTSLRSP